MESNQEGAGNRCLEVDGMMKCIDPSPSDDKNCTMIGGTAFCKKDDAPATFKQERKKFFNVLFYPRLRKKEASMLENNMVDFTIGLVLSSIVFTLSFFIKDIIDYITAMIFPSSITIVTLVFIIAILIMISLVLAFLQTRFKTAIDETELLEKLSEKDAADVVQSLFE